MHIHGPGCGHEAIVHQGHIDFLVDGELVNDGEVHNIDNQESSCQAGAHSHSDQCLSIRHGNHLDCLVNNRLLHRHGDHDDDHGPLIRAEL